MFVVILRFLVTVVMVPIVAHYLPSITMVTQQGAIYLGIALTLIYTVVRPVTKMLLHVINFFTLELLYIVGDAVIAYTASTLIPQSIVFETPYWALAIAIAINVSRTLIDAITGSLKR